MKQQAITLTPAAVDRIKVLLQKREKPAIGIRISLKTKGCSGLSYQMEYVDTIDPMDEVVAHDDITVFIDMKATLFILGTEMDFVGDKTQSGFVFNNPNEKGRCGCGKSFRV